MTLMAGYKSSNPNEIEGVHITNHAGHVVDSLLEFPPLVLLNEAYGVWTGPKKELLRSSGSIVAILDGDVLYSTTAGTTQDASVEIEGSHDGSVFASLFTLNLSRAANTTDPVAVSQVFSIGYKYIRARIVSNAGGTHVTVLCV